MKICLVGDFSPDLDEGYKNISHYLARELEIRHEVYRMNVKRINRPDFWRRVRAVQPDIIHTIAQPTHPSIVLTHLLKRLHPAARTVVSGLRSDRYFHTGVVRRSQRLLFGTARPDLVLDQSQAAAGLFRQLECRVHEVPNGVDLDRFRPVSAARKRELRAKYCLDSERPVVFHAGHLSRDRNLLSLQSLPHRDIQVLIAGSLYMGRDRDLIDQLRRAGFRLLEGYQPHVEELYALADCYVFPVTPGCSLTMPLSVLEAMACNLPVVTTRFSGLTAAFNEGAGVRFVDEPHSIADAVSELLASPTVSNTRELVRPLSWQSVASKVERCYEELLRA